MNLQGKLQGVLLIDSLVAATILLGCLAVFIQTLMLGLRTMQEEEDYTTAEVLLENKMIPLVQKGYIADSLKEIETYEKPYGKFSYTVVSFPLHNKSGEKEINEVTLTVRWLSGKNPRDISLSTFLFKKNEL